jgi:hypothetical protein
MGGGVMMASPKETIILYDGKQIASFLAGQTATLTTKGDEVEHNIVVVAGSGGGGSSAPRCKVEVVEGGLFVSSNLFESAVVNIAVETSVSSKSRVSVPLEYDVYAGTWFIHSGGVTTTSDPVVTYAFIVKKGTTYKVTMAEIGNRLRRTFSSVNPASFVGNESDIFSDFVDDTDSLAVGYSFEYKATADGWYLLYVSNAGEAPNINIEEYIWVDDN